MKISIDVTPSFPEVILCKFHLSRIFRLNVALLRMNLLYFVIIFRNFRYFPFSHCIAASTDHKKCYYSWGDFVTNYHQIRRASIEGSNCLITKGEYSALFVGWVDGGGIINVFS